MPSNIQWDQTGPYTIRANTGEKHYLSPIEAFATNRGEPDPRLAAFASQHGANISDPQTNADGAVVAPGVASSGAPKGGLFKVGGEWNAKTGKFDQGLNWGVIIPMLAAAGLTGGAGISAMVGGGAGLGAPVGASLGMSSALPGAVGSVPGLATGAGATMAGLLPSTQIGTGMMAGLPGATASTVASGGSKIGSLISKLIGNRDNAADLSSLLGSFGQGRMNQRGMQGNFTQAYDRNMLGAEQGRNATESDAMKKLAQTSYILNGHGAPSPTSIMLNGQQREVPTLGTSYTAPSEAQKQGATSLQDQLTKRLAPGGTYTPQPLSSYATPGILENVGQFGAAGLGIGSTIYDMLRNKG